MQKTGAACIIEGPAQEHAVPGIGMQTTATNGATAHINPFMTGDNSERTHRDPFSIDSGCIATEATVPDLAQRQSSSGVGPTVQAQREGQTQYQPK